MKKKYGVLVVDDSVLMRKAISDIIDASNDFFVIGKARNGWDAIDKVKHLKPDIVTLDVEMPELNGLEALKVIMKECPVPVVMLSNGADSTLEAFELGAIDFVVKEFIIKKSEQPELSDFYKRLTVAINAKLPLPMKNIIPNQNVKEIIKAHSFVKGDNQKELIIIGSSTGGPAALQTILKQFPKNFRIPIVVIQHMPPGFTKPLAERFNSICQLHVKEAEQNEKLLPGTIYIAPAGLQTTLIKNAMDEFTIKLKITTSIDTIFKPSVDVTLLSVAPICNNLLVVILTGMGDDGLRGCQLVKQNGGTILSESEKTCVVYGMPKAVFEAGLSDKKVPLHVMFDQIMGFI